ncbi:MAG TPA: hypothetical protein VEG32_03635 [Clostridia bacterium]|nr:hypothetical protein [Clostridia bacterium]
MRTVRAVIATVAVFGGMALAQEAPAQPSAEMKPQLNQPEVLNPPDVLNQPKAAKGLVLAAGTKIPLVLKHAISTKNAREGDSVYAETSFPVVVNGRIVVPAGTYVQGVITRTQRAGRVKGRSELLVHFTSMIFPSGYTVMLPGAVDNVPGSETSTMKDEEGTMLGEGGKGKDATRVASTTATGAAIGGIAARGGGKGVAIGSGAGAAVGLATMLFSRGPDLRLESGSTVEMVLERPITIDTHRAMRN